MRRSGATPIAARSVSRGPHLVFNVNSHMHWPTPTSHIPPISRHSTRELDRCRSICIVVNDIFIYIRSTGYIELIRILTRSSEIKDIKFVSLSIHQ